MKKERGKRWAREKRVNVEEAIEENVEVEGG